MSHVAVLDVGKTNVKLHVASADAALLETATTPNLVLDGPPYRSHDLAGQEDWLMAGLRELGSRFAIEAFVACAHGSGGVLVGDRAPLMPMIDYEQSAPVAVDDAYRRAIGSYRERGSVIMPGATHLARQMLWFDHSRPGVLASARAMLATPQYWAWRLCGVAASEVTSLAAQSHLWSPADRRLSGFVATNGWNRLIPPLCPAWQTLGRLLPDVADRAGLGGDTRVLCGIHDSSANLYRYRSAGLSGMTVISTGTWIVALSDRGEVDPDLERQGRFCGADVHGAPVPGMLIMGGREFSAVADGRAGPARVDMLARLVDSRTFALPFFGFEDGIFPGRARRGRVVGPLASEPAFRFTLAVLYVALLTAECLRSLPPSDTVVLDGSFVRDPLFGALVQAMQPAARVLVNHEATGTATGTALLASHENRRGIVPLPLTVPKSLDLSDLTSYRSEWQARAADVEEAQ